MAADHASLVRSAIRWLRARPRGCCPVLAELTSACTGVTYEPDAIGWTAGSRSAHLVECKTSRADLARDAKKHRVRTGALPGRWRWYLVPAGLLRPDDAVPDGWGLLEQPKHPSLLPRVVLQAPEHRSTRDVDFEVRLLATAGRYHERGYRWLPDEARFESMNRRLRREEREDHERPLTLFEATALLAGNGSSGSDR